MTHNTGSGCAEIVDLGAYRALRAQRDAAVASIDLQKFPMPAPLFIAPVAYGWIWAGIAMVPCAVMPVLVQEGGHG